MYGRYATWHRRLVRSNPGEKCFLLRSQPFVQLKSLLQQTIRARFSHHMARGQPTARTRAWQTKQHVETVSDVFPPVLGELHPIDRAFNTLSIFLQAALVTAQAENSKTVIFIQPAFTWLKDCYEWHQEIQKSRDVLQQQMRAKQEEFDVHNTELGQLRDRITLFQEHQRQNAHRNVRELALNIDGDIEHYKSVSISLNAKVA